MPLYPSKCCKLGSVPRFLSLSLSFTWTHIRVFPGVGSASQGLHLNVILSRDPQVESPKILEIGTFDTLEGHNFLCKPLIEVRFKAKL
jgi:hypothetical protein